LWIVETVRLDSKKVVKLAIANEKVEFVKTMLEICRE
jgi:hypothetical protein